MSDLSQCQTLTDGQRCEGAVAFVYASPHAIRLVCDDCAGRYRVQPTGFAPVAPLLPIAVHELVPAREVLMKRLGDLEKSFLKRDREGDLMADLVGKLLLTILGGGFAGLLMLFWRFAVYAEPIAIGATMILSMTWVLLNGNARQKLDEEFQ